ncbi:tetratricopeptide repeat protein [Catenulispora subtropica]|uniref:tetratricopeptide repeat protein n=1 Tax=Catenulispora subtropica TaxID=450798 RepID=UPI0031DC8550
MTAPDDVPDPDQVTDLPGFITALGRLRLWAGAPSYRTLARQVGPLLRQPQQVSASTLRDAFRPDRRRLDFDLVVAMVRALGLDAAEVERWRQACVRVHAEAKTGGPVGVFRQLPADLPTFTGREPELRRLLAAVPAPGPAPREAGGAAEAGAPTMVISAIEGMAGIGKTQLALRAAHTLVRAGRYADVQLYVNLRGFDPDWPPADPSAVLEAFLRQLEVAPQHIPEGVDERAAMFRDRIHGRAALLVLDNAASEEQVRPLIPGSARCLVIVTSRRTLAGLDGTELYRLDVFGTDEGVALLTRLGGAERVAAEPEAAREIVALCGHLPLAITLAATRLRSRPSWTLEGLAGRLRSGIATLAVAGRSMPAAFDLSYQELAPASRRMFRLLGLHPGLDATAGSAAALADLDPAEAERILEELCDEHLVLQRTQDRYELHDLLRAYAAERAAAEMTPASRSAAVARVVMWYAAAMTAAAAAESPGRTLPPPVAETPDHVPGFGGAGEALAFYERERSNLARVVATAVDQGLNELAWYLPVVTQRLAAIAADWQGQEHLNAIALDAAGRSHDDVARAWVLRIVGSSRLQGPAPDPNGAVVPLLQALEIFHDHKDRLLEAHVQSELALARAKSGLPESAVANAEEALALYRQVGDDHGEIGALTTLAVCLHELGRPRDALTMVQLVVAKAREGGYRTRVAYGLRNLGYTHLVLEEFEEARAALEEAVKVSGDIGERYIHLDAMNGIARALHDAGRGDEALEQHRRFLEALDDLPPTLAERFRQQLEKSTLRYTPDASGTLSE